MLDDDEAVFGVLEGGDEEAADDAEDEDVAPHDGVVEKYNGDGEPLVCRRPLDTVNDKYIDQSFGRYQLQP